MLAMLRNPQNFPPAAGYASVMLYVSLHSTMSQFNNYANRRDLPVSNSVHVGWCLARKYLTNNVLQDRCQN